MVVNIYVAISWDYIYISHSADSQPTTLQELQPLPHNGEQINEDMSAGYHPDTLK